MTDPVTLQIDPDPHNRIARIHEALRDLGLELCSKCHIWKDEERIVYIGVDSTAGAPSFSYTICCPCFSAPSTPREAECGEGRGGGANAPALATACREAAAPCSAWDR